MLDVLAVAPWCTHLSLTRCIGHGLVKYSTLSILLNLGASVIWLALACFGPGDRVILISREGREGAARY